MSFVQKILSGVGEMALAGEKGVGEQMAPIRVFKEPRSEDQYTAL